MGINATQLREQIVSPTLHTLGLWSPAAEDLILGTCAVESRMGHYLVQVGGPALGICQMEPVTHDDIWENYLAYKHRLADVVESLVVQPVARALVFDLRYAVAMCRVHYLRCPEALPKHGDVNGYGAYWKKYYNTPLGKGSVQKFVDAYHKYVAE